MKMKKQRSFLIIKIVLLTAVIGGLLYAMNAGAGPLLAVAQRAGGAAHPAGRRPVYPQLSGLL